jgi:hypothetical protein
MVFFYVPLLYFTIFFFLFLLLLIIFDPPQRLTFHSIIESEDNLHTYRPPAALWQTTSTFTLLAGWITKAA